MAAAAAAVEAAADTVEAATNRNDERGMMDLRRFIIQRFAVQRQLQKTDATQTAPTSLYLQTSAGKSFTKRNLLRFNKVNKP